MPEKSVREMGKLERRHYSLEARTFHSTIMGAIVLGLAALVIGLGLYTYALVNQYITEAFTLSSSAAAILQEVVDIQPLSDQVLSAYRAQTQEEREQTGTAAYRSRFSAFTQREDYQLTCRVLGKFKSAVDMDAIYLAMYDRETSAMVYLADPNEGEDTAMLPGDWDAVNPKGMEHFLTWDGQGKLYAIERTARYGWLCTSGVPLRDSDGEITGFVLSDISLANVGHGMKNFVLQYAAAMVVLVNLVGFFMTRHMKKKLVMPINAIAEAARRYVEDRRAGLKDTDHFAMLNIRTGDEVENLSLVMADMEQDLSAYEDDLTRITAEKERISAELSLATRIQADMLPNIYPAFPDRSEFDIYATMDPAREVGGDFYDFFLVDEDHLCMVMADVSGKGVPAALFMMASKIIIANNAMMGKSPAQILTDTNAAICSNNREEMFITVWLGVLEISTGRVTAANAGHEYPVLKAAGGDFALVQDKHGLVVGAMAGVKYREYTLDLTPGAKLFVYTDGVPEAMDAHDRLFGTERMLEALNAAPEAPTTQILQNVRRAVDSFVQEAEQFDDLTMLCLEYRGGTSA